MEYHLVLFKLMPSAPVDEAERIFKQLDILPKKTEVGIASIEYGPIKDSSVPDKYSHWIAVGFANEGQRKKFNSDSTRRVFCNELSSFVDDSIVLDMGRTHVPYKTMPLPPKIVHQQITSAKSL